MQSSAAFHVFAVIVITAVISVAEEPQDCPAKLKHCRCTETSVVCNNTHFRQVQLFQYVPDFMTKKVVFTENEFQELPGPLFGVDNEMEDLTWLDLSNNHIQHVHGHTFNHMPNLEVLILGNNDIHIGSRSETHNVTGLHTRLFSNLPKLKV